jgi:hypothetical protein
MDSDAVASVLPRTIIGTYGSKLSTGNEMGPLKSLAVDFSAWMLFGFLLAALLLGMLTACFGVLKLMLNFFRQTDQRSIPQISNGSPENCSDSTDESAVVAAVCGDKATAILPEDTETTPVDEVDAAGPCDRDTEDKANAIFTEDTETTPVDEADAAGPCDKDTEVVLSTSLEESDKCEAPKLLQAMRSKHDRIL